MDLGNIKEKMNSKNFSRKVLNFFYWEISWILLLIFIMLSGYCVFVWYRYVYKPYWSEAQKTQYIKANSNGVTYDKNDFQAAIDEKSRRDSDYQKDMGNPTDIFRLNQNNSSGAGSNSGNSNH